MGRLGIGSVPGSIGSVAGAEDPLGLGLGLGLGEPPGAGTAPVSAPVPGNVDTVTEDCPAFPDRSTTTIVMVC